MKKTILILFTLFSLTVGYCQKATLDDVELITIRNIHAMQVGGKIQGYFVLYKLDKKDRKNDHLHFKVMNKALEVTHQKDLIKPSGTQLLEGSFNGKIFCFAFFKPNDEVTLDFYSQKLDLIKEVKIKISPSQAQVLLNFNNPNSDRNMLLHPIPNTGFSVIRQDDSKGDKANIIAYDNEGKQLWNTHPGVEGKAYENASIMDLNENALIAVISSRPKLMSVKDLNTWVSLINAQTGALIGKIQTQDLDHCLMPYGVNYDQKKNQYFVYGEYFGLKKGSIDLNDKLGIGIIKATAMGNVLSRSYHPYSGALGQKMNLDADGKINGENSFLIQNIISTSDNKYFAILEEYKMKTGGGKAALTVLSRGMTNSGKLELSNIDVVQFDKEFNFQSIKTFSKPTSTSPVPSSLALISKDKQAFVLKAFGEFDYKFTSLNDDNNQFTAVYKNVNSDNEKIIGMIGLNEEGNLVETSIPANENADVVDVLPAVPGYVGVFEYFSKEKNANLELKKFDF